jgi:hypothetical protein
LASTAFAGSYQACYIAESPKQYDVGKIIQIFNSKHKFSKLEKGSKKNSNGVRLKVLEFKSNENFLQADVDLWVVKDGKVVPR